MSAPSTPAAADPGALAAVVERLPPGWRERLGGALELDPARLDWLGDESGRVAGNLLFLVERGWPEIAAVGGRLAVLSLGGMLLAALASALLGWLLYLFAAGPLLRRGWRTGRLLGCCAATAVLLSAGAGGAWAGLWLGAGKATAEAIEERYVVERLAAATFLAFTLSRDDLPEDVGPEAVGGLLAGAQRHSAEAWSEFQERARAVEASGGSRAAWLSPALMAGVVERLGGGAAPDLAALHRVLTTAGAADGEDPLPATAGIRQSSVELLWGTVWVQVATGLGFGLAVPLGGLVLLGLLGLLVRRGQPPRPSPVA